MSYLTRPDFIGFDRVFNLLNETSISDKFPPYNILQNDDEFTVELAVAGFEDNQLNVKIQENQLIVSGLGESDIDEPHNYIHRGIAQRAFIRKFKLSDDMVVDSANVDSGILKIKLHRHIPEEKKPREIPINSIKTLLTEDKKGVWYKNRN